MTKKFIILYLILSVLFRFYLVNFHNVIERPDSVTYITTGKNLFNGIGYINQNNYYELAKPPFYPILIGLTSLFINDFEFAGRLASIIFGVLLVIPVFLLGKRFYGETAGHIAAVLVIFYPVLSHYSILVMTESTYTFIFILSILLGWNCISTEKIIYHIFIGVLFGLATLTRPEACMFFFIYIIVYLFFKYRDLYSHPKRISTLIILMGITFSIVIFPYINFIHKHTGEWSLGSKSSSVFDRAYITVNDEYGYEKSHYSFPNKEKDKENLSLFRYFFINPKGVFKYYLSNVYKILFAKHILLELIPVVLFLPLGLKLFQKGWNWEKLKKELYLFLFLIPPLFLYPFFLVHSRRFVPFTPIIILYAASGIMSLQDWLSNYVNKLNFYKFDKYLCGKLIKKCILAVFVIFIIWQAIIIDKKEIGNIRDKKTGLWLKNNTPEQSAIMDRYPIIPYYADRRRVTFPYGEDYREILEYAKNEGINYLVVDYKLINLRKKLTYLKNWYEGKDIPPELKLIFELKDDPARKVLIYEVNNWFIPIK